MGKVSNCGGAVYILLLTTLFSSLDYRYLWSLYCIMSLCNNIKTYLRGNMSATISSRVFNALPEGSWFWPKWRPIILPVFVYHFTSYLIIPYFPSLCSARMSPRQSLKGMERPQQCWVVEVLFSLSRQVLNRLCRCGCCWGIVHVFSGVWQSCVDELVGILIVEWNPGILSCWGYSFMNEVLGFLSCWEGSLLSDF